MFSGFHLGFLRWLWFCASPLPQFIWKRWWYQIILPLLSNNKRILWAELGLRSIGMSAVIVHQHALFWDLALIVQQLFPLILVGWTSTPAFWRPWMKCKRFCEFLFDAKNYTIRAMIHDCWLFHSPLIASTAKLFCELPMSILNLTLEMLTTTVALTTGPMYGLGQQRGGCWLLCVIWIARF